MKTGFSEAATHFKSASQSARVDTESWAKLHMFCPNCGCDALTSFPANKPVADFYCNDCNDEFELKSQQKNFGRKVADGAYDTKISRLAANNSPNLILLQYDKSKREVLNLKVVPKFLFVPSTIERRKPLKTTARRAGWVGSNIILERIPKSGQIPVIQNGIVRERADVLHDWNRLRFLDGKFGDTKGWLLEVMHCIEDIGLTEFSISDVYDFEHRLRRLYPSNNNVRPKIRQQLQVLRDSGYLHFVGNGHYRLNGC